MKYLLPLLLIQITLSCGSSGRFNADKVTAIHYSFYTAGILSEQHTDYEIYIKPGEALFVASSFGTEIERQSTPITDEQMQSLVETLNKADLKDGTEKSTQGCPKVFDEHLSVFEDNKGVYYSTLSYCYDQERPNPESLGDLSASYEAIFKLVPDLDESEFDS